MTSATNSIVPAVIIGAGPYGLTLAAHLREAGIPFRIFGRPMQTWATQMPIGMKLKSDGFASNLSAGSKSFTLEDFCRLTGRPYHPTLIPVALEDFIAYGQEFARRFVPHLEQTDVASVEQERILGPLDAPAQRSTGFLLTLATGERLRAQHVIVATGLSHFQHIPQRLAALSKVLVTHTSDHTTFNEFANRDVVVLGRGASSLNAAALLHEAGSRVILVSRNPRIHIHRPPQDQPLPFLARLRHPVTPIGHSLRSWLSCAAPNLLHALPGRVRRLLVYKHLGPAGGHSLQGRIEGKFPIHLGWSIDSSELLYKLGKGGTGESLIKLNLVDAQGERKQILTSHVIAGTGFRISLARMRFLDDHLRDAIRVGKSGTPRLSRSFQSNVRGLHFVGPIGAPSFGPLLRFTAGAEFAATQVTTHLHRILAPRASRLPEKQEQPTSPVRLTS